MPASKPVLHHYLAPPDGFLDAPAGAMLELLGGPSLIEIPGLRQQPVFLSVLLHGNETSGLLALQRLLRRHRERPLPRRLVVFVGNVYAAVDGQRRLAGQVDYNRIWPGGEDAATEEAGLAREVVRRMAQRRPFASIDIHNNTGRNPFYGCINRLDPRFVALASLFSRTLVYFTRPRGVQSIAFAGLCPAVTVECGRPGLQAGVEHAEGFIEAALHLAEIPGQPAVADIVVYQTVATVRVPESQAVVFSHDGGHDSANGGIAFLDDLDSLNFQQLPEGTVLARYDGPGVPLLVEDEDGFDMAEQYFKVENGELMTRRRLVLSMLTLDQRVIRQDCLCYVMEEADQA